MQTLLVIATILLAAEPDPLARWQSGVTVRPVSPQPGRHTIHSYYVTTPESPDGRHVLYYVSQAANGHVGDLCVVERASGVETVLVRGLNTEDAHRAACQQWVSGGRRVAYHDVRDGQWVVAVVDVDALRERVLVRDRQLGFGQGADDLLPVYGCHWKPGRHRDLELVHAATGELRTVVTAEAVRAAYGDWVQKEFGGQPISIFFPVLSPDRKRVFFKLAAGSGSDNFRSSAASHRQGLLGFDLEEDRLLFMRPKWGHPAWSPDSRWIIEMGNLLIDSDDGATRRIPDQPQLRGCHPSLSPDGRLFVEDGLSESIGGPPGQWAILVGDLRGRRHVILHRFDNTRGARSWRPSHPHPVFSPDGRRIYFNVSSGDWTQLYVAEAGGAE